MVEPVNYGQYLLSRTAGFCAGQNAKTLVVACGKAVKSVAQDIAYLKLHDIIEVLDVTGGDTTGKYAIMVEPQFRVVLIAVDTSAMMHAVGGLCSGYKGAGIPVVVIDGWPPPMTARLFHSEAQRGGNMGVAAMFEVAAGYCRGIKGDILEFGTFQGFSLQCAYHGFNARGQTRNRRFVAFDSFAGISGSKDDENFRDGTYSASEASFMFSNYLADVPKEYIAIVSGPFETTLKTDIAQTRRTLGPTQAALVHIDCDVEVPAKLALDFVTPYLQQGSLLLFDEYDLHRADNTKGERAALRAWLSENPAFEVEPFRNYHTHARSFIVHKHGDA